ncbi:hypothetical protein KAT63_05405 [Candidatus Parcubacteria bacterium]|nr:hypothetical protein [Candidatus Parcubacteria bacterium]
MQDSIFTTELPIIRTDKELEQIKSLYPNYDTYFVASGCIKKRREKFNKLWRSFKPLADKHFLSDIKKHFHQRTWEMYFGNILLGKNLFIESKNEGPDFIVNKNIYIECVACEKGDKNKPDSVPEMHVACNPNEMQVQDVPTDEMILRITNSLEEKAIKKYDKWKNKNWFNKKAPFIIAINTEDLGHVEDSSMPNVVKALFGFQFMQINLKNGKTNYSYRNKIEKSNKSPISVNYFINNDFNFVSGVLFSNKTVLNHPDNIGDDCIFVNNPFAEYSVDKSFTKLFNNWYAETENNGIKLTKNY